MIARAVLFSVACAVSAGCDGQARPATPARSATRPERVLVFTRAPEDGRIYDTTKELAATSGSARRARERLVHEAEKHRCTAIQISEEWSEQVPDVEGGRRFFVRGKCLVAR